ncbi:MAG: diphthine--ammonia ligase [Thermogladius sp.]|nr:diphthine--ammonia ligase [Thermogladius sp.]
MALIKALENGFKVVSLISIQPLYDYSMLYHRPVFSALSLQAYSLGIPLESISVANENREKDALEKILERVKARYGITHVVTGGIASRFQKKAFEEVSRKIGLETYSPLWGVDQEEYLYMLLERGIKFMIISITTMGLPHRLLGKVLDREDVDTIIRLSRKYGFNPSFEGGEAETFVVDMPLFKYALRVEGSPRILGEYEAVFEVRKISLSRKTPS